MQVQSVIKSIKRGVISPIYLLYGSEEFLQEKVIRALKEALVSAEIGSFNLDELEGEEITVGELVDLANTLPVFAEKRLVIVRDFPLLQSSNKKAKTEKDGETPQPNKENKGNEEKRLLEYLADPLATTCLVFWQKGNIHRGRKIYKAIVENGHQVLGINSLRGRNLDRWLLAEAEKKGKSLEPQAVNYLVFNCGDKLRDLHNELEKLFLYSGEEKTITLAMAQELVTKSSEGNIFNLVDSIGEKNGEKALVELRNLLATGEIPIKIVYMITRQFRLILLVKELRQKGCPEKEITAKLNLHPYVTGKIRRQADNFSFLELEKSLELIRKYDLGLKSGLRSPLTLENLIIALAS